VHLDLLLRGASVLDGTGGPPRPLTDGPGGLQGLRVIWRLYEAERRGVIADLRDLGLDQDWDRPGLGPARTGRAAVVSRRECRGGP
jgi:hypothetical protein